MSDWVELAHYFDHGDYWIDLDAWGGLLRTAYDEERTDAIVQSLTRAPERDFAFGTNAVLMQTDRFGVDDEDTVFIDGAAFIAEEVAR